MEACWRGNRSVGPRAKLAQLIPHRIKRQMQENLTERPRIRVSEEGMDLQKRPCAKTAKRHGNGRVTWNRKTPPSDRSIEGSQGGSPGNTQN